MRLLRHDLRLVAGDYHLQRVASDDKGLRPHQRLAIVVDSAESLATNFNDAVAIVVDSAESLATNFNDARLSSRTQTATIRQETTQTAMIRQETTQTATIRQETTQTATIRQETTSRIAFWTLPDRLPGI